MVEKQMRLEEMLGREMTIRWFEGVALIQAVCRQLLAHERHHDAFPTAAEILLAADGTVATLHASGRTAVRTAAQLLSRMLSEDVPVRLRLIVAQATGADTAYPTLEEFSTHSPTSSGRTAARCCGHCSSGPWRRQPARTRRSRRLRLPSWRKKSSRTGHALGPTCDWLSGLR